MKDALHRTAREARARERQQEEHIGELERAEAALQEGEERLKRMFETMADGLVVFDSEGRITMVNAAAERIFGMPRAELIGRPHDAPPWTNARPDGSVLPLADHPFHRVTRTGQSVLGFEQAFRRPDGHWVFVSISAAPLHDPEGCLSGVISVLTDVTARRKAEQALRESEARFRALAVQAPVGIFETDAQGRCLFVNQHWKEIAGVSPEQLPESCCPETLHPDDRSRILAELSGLLAGTAGSDLATEGRFLRPEGAVVSFTMRVTALKNDAGHTTGLLGVVIDVTERTRAAEELRRSQDRFSKAFRSSPAATSITTLDEGRYIDVNDAFLALVGRRRDEVIGRTSLDINLWESAAERTASAQRLRETGSKRNVERRFRNKAGEIRDAVSSSELIELDGQPCSLAMLVDITERKRTDEAQRFMAEASRQIAGSLDLETILTNLARLAVPAIGDLCVVNMIDEVASMSPVGVAHVEPAKEEVLHRLLQEYPPRPGDPGDHSAVLRTGQSILAPVVPEEEMMAGAEDDGERHLLQALAMVSYIMVPIIVRGQVTGIITIASSISGRHYTPADLALLEDLARRVATAVDNARLYQEARAAIQARDEFLSVAAHELRTPVTSLRGFAQLLDQQLERGGELDMVRLRRAVQTIDRQSVKLTALVSNLLDISRLEAGRLAIERRPTDLAALVKGVASAVQAVAEQHTIIVRSPRRLPAVVDPIRLEQVVTNLVDNAIRYSPEGGPITLDLTVPSPDLAQLTVTDQGIGIPPEHREHVFDRFYQAHASRHLGGMGLGLFISREIVLMHGGSITAEFPRQGGTAFVVTLPIGAPVGGKPARAEASQGRAEGTATEY